MNWLRTQSNEDTNQKSETALSEKSYNDATVKALFRLMDKLKERDHVINMTVDNRMTSTGLYKVELTATYDQQTNKGRNSIDDLKSKLENAMHSAKGKPRHYNSYPAEQVAKMYRQNDSDDFQKAS